MEAKSQMLSWARFEINQYFIKGNALNSLPEETKLHSIERKLSFLEGFFRAKGWVIPEDFLFYFTARRDDLIESHWREVAKKKD